MSIVWPLVTSFPFQLSVLSNLPFDGFLDEADLVWPDEIEDPQVDLLVSLIRQKHKFTPSEWPVFKPAPVRTPGNSSPLTDTSTVPRKVDSRAAGTQGGKRLKTVHPNYPRKPFTRSAKKNAQEFLHVKQQGKQPRANCQTNPPSSSKSPPLQILSPILS